MKDETKNKLEENKQGNEIDINKEREIQEFIKNWYTLSDKAKEILLLYIKDIKIAETAAKLFESTTEETKEILKKAIKEENHILAILAYQKLANESLERGTNKCTQ